jgi:hypothetical protein
MPIDRDGEGPSLRREDPRPSAPDNRGGDLRATPFTDDVFDDDYYGRRGRSSAGGSRSLSVVIGVGLGIAVAGGIGWYFFGERAKARSSRPSPRLTKSAPTVLAACRSRIRTSWFTTASPKAKPRRASRIFSRPPRNPRPRP